MKQEEVHQLLQKLKKAKDLSDEEKLVLLREFVRESEVLNSSLQNLAKFFKL